MAPQDTIIVIVKTDLKRFIRRFSTQSSGRLALSIVLAVMMLGPALLLALGGGAILGIKDDPLLELRAVFLFVSVSSFVLSLMAFVSTNANRSETDFLLLSSASRFQVVIGKVLAVAIPISAFYMGLGFIFMFSFSAGASPLYAIPGLLALALALACSSFLAYMISFPILALFKTGSSLRIFKVLGLFAISVMLIGMRFVVTLSVRYLSVSDYVPPSWGADLMLLRPAGSLMFLGYLLLIPLSIALSARVSVWYWLKDDPAMELGNGGRRGASWFGDSPAMVIAEKELKTTMREPEMLIRGGVVFVLLALWPFMTVFMGSGFDPMVVPTSLVLLGCMIGLILNPNSLGTEAGRLWMLRTSPQSPSDLFLGKWFLGSILCMPLLMLLVLVYFSLGWLTVLEAVSLLVLSALIGLFAPGMSVGVGFLFPDFERAKRNRPGILGLFALIGLAYLSFLPALIVITYDILNPRPLLLETILAIAGLTASALLCTGVLWALYKNLKSTYLDLEKVQGGSYI